MRDQLEDELRLLLAEDADRAPTSVKLLPQVKVIVRQRRHRARLKWVGASAAAVTAAGLTAAILTGALDHSPGDRPGLSAEVVSGHGALPGDEQGSCAKEYSPSEVAQRAFAFSGTVRSIGPSRTNRDGMAMPLVSATFHVDQWFKGGAGQTVIIDIVDPKGPVRTSDDSPSYSIGTRLLVSGEHRWDVGDPNDLLAWSCGFTRYYDTATAQSWRAAMG